MRLFASALMFNRVQKPIFRLFLSFAMIYIKFGIGMKDKAARQATCMLPHCFEKGTKPIKIRMQKGFIFSALLCDQHFISIATDMTEDERKALA